MRGFKEHGLMLFLGKPLYNAFIKLQADKGLGRSYAGLLSFTSGLYYLGYLSKIDYEELARMTSYRTINAAFSTFQAKSLGNNQM